MILPFFGNLVDPAAIAIIDVDRNISYGDLIDDISNWQNQIDLQQKSLVFFYLENAANVVAPLLACMASHHAVALLDINLSNAIKHDLETKYQPELVVNAHQNAVTFAHRDTSAVDISDDLSVLLSTSGSTGSPKFVRLSRDAIISNAFAIAKSQDLCADSRASAHLDIHYSYGMSVLFSHLACGSSVAFSRYSFMEKEFWAHLEEQKVSHLPGVPFHYQMMRRLRLERMNLSHLKVMTQAGGHLDPDNKKHFYEMMTARQGRFLVMYGQTEAGPRITTLKHEDFDAHHGSVGQSLEGGQIKIVDAQGKEQPLGHEGIVQYSGPNVMMGYANNRDDLGHGDSLGGVLQTGDIGKIDGDAILTITGRNERMGKVYGWRINLDEIEKRLNEAMLCAVVQIDETIHIAHENAEHSDELVDALVKEMNLPASIFKSATIDAIPRTDRGKTDYRSLKLILA